VGGGGEGVAQARRVAAVVDQAGRDRGAFVQVGAGDHAAAGLGRRARVAGDHVQVAARGGVAAIDGLERGGRGGVEEPGAVELLGERRPGIEVAHSQGPP
jgi:hypothetical protein